MNVARACAIAYVVALAVSLFVLFVGGVGTQRVAMTGVDDFSKIWAGPRALVVGSDPYDPLTWPDTAVRLGTFPPDTQVYLYPPWVAVALVPLAVVPLPVATAIWVAGGMILAAALFFALCRAYLPPDPRLFATAAAMLVLSGPAISALLTGQWSFVLVAALCAVVLALRSGRAWIAALASLLMIAKPQLFLYAAPALALHALWPHPLRDRSMGVRYVVAALAGGGALVATAWVIVPDWWPAYATFVGGKQLSPESVSLPGLLVRNLGFTGAVLGVFALVGAVVLALRFHPRGAAWLPVWLTLSVAAVPYSNPYDLLLLVVPVMLATGALVSRRGRGSVVLYGSALLLLLVETLLHALSGSVRYLEYAPLVPAAEFALIATALWPLRKEVATDGI